MDEIAANFAECNNHIQPATSESVVDERILDSVPGYVKNRIILNGGKSASITATTLLDVMLADYCRKPRTELKIHKPYLEEGVDDRLLPEAAASVSNEFEEQMAITESLTVH